MFKAIRNADHASLRTLAKIFIGAGNYPAALLCLDNVFSSPPRLRNLPLTGVRASLSLYLDYIRLLNKLRRDGSLAQGSARQRLFGFQVLEWNSYLVPEQSSLYKKLTNQSGSSRKSMGGYICNYDELSRSITHFILSRASERTKAQNASCRDVHVFSPCLQLLVQGKCNPLKGTEPCTFQHIRPENLTVGWYHARLRLILLQFQILDSACYDDLDVKKYVLVHSAGSTCGYSLDVKSLAWGVVLSTSPTLSEARIIGES